MTQQRSDHSDDSTMSHCFWATVKVLCKECINPCCNSVYMPWWWQFKGLPNNLPLTPPPRRETSACFMVWKAQRDHFHSKNVFITKFIQNSLNLMNIMFAPVFKSDSAFKNWYCGMIFDLVIKFAWMFKIVSKFWPLKCILIFGNKK